MAEPASGGQPAFDLGQQHDCHEALNTMLELLSSEDMFDKLQLQWDTRYLGSCSVVSMVVRV